MQYYFNTPAQAAQAYARLGWAVLPCKPHSKEPLTPHGVHDASHNPDTIRQWWKQWPDANVAVATGTPSGLVVLDVDPRSDGHTTLEALLAMYARGPLPDTPTVCTGGGGFHYYFRLPQGRRVHKRRLGPGLDLQADGVYVVAPPSVHPSGQAYQWQEGCTPWEVEPAPAPEWLLTQAGERDRGRYDAWDGTPIPEGWRNNHLTSLGGYLRAAGLSQEAIEAALLAENVRRFESPLPEDEVRAIAKSMAKYPPRSNLLHDNPSGLAGDSTGSREVIEDLLRQLAEAFTDVNLARLLADLAQDKALYVPEWGWLWWDGQRWVRDNGGHRVVEYAMDTLPRHYIQRAQEATGEARREYLGYALRCMSKQRISAAVDLARTLMLAHPYEFDRDPYILNCLNGAVDLRTGELRPHLPQARLTKLVPVRYDPLARAPTWERFLREVFCDDIDLIAYVQRAVGYSATGDVSEDKLFINYGTGSNGKTTFMDTLRYVLGDYAKPVNTDVLVSDPDRSDSHPAVLADLAGVRLAVAAEMGEERRLNESRVKVLTGRDPIRARFLRHDYFTFEPSHKLWLSTNHLPQITDTTEGMWRRLAVIPFKAYFPPERRDRTLPKRLRQEAAGILAWVVRGAIAWWKQGLGTAEPVQHATEQYRTDMDVLACWLDERCVLDPQSSTPFADLYQDYETWCKAARTYPISQRGFAMRLDEKGFTAHKGTGGVRMRKGLRLRGS